MLRISALTIVVFVLGCNTFSEAERKEDTGFEQTRSSNRSKKTSNFRYTILSDTRIRNVKRSVDVRLPKRVSESTLSEIAKTIKRSTQANHDRTFICFYLPDMEVSAGCWATAHYNPKLDVKIIGLPLDAINRFSATEENDRSEIGCWLDETPFIGRIIVIFTDDRKLFMESTFGDGSKATEEIAESESPYGRRFDAIASKPTGEYWLIDAEDNLQLWDREGFVNNSKPMRKLKS